MAIRLDALPEAFAKAAWSRISQDVEASPELKERMLETLLRLHRKSADKREAVRVLGALVYQVPWGMPRIERLLEDQLNETPTDEDKLDALFRWFTMATHKLWRRGQIRAGLKDRPGRVVHFSVGVDVGEIAPCGLKDGDCQPASDDLLKRIPPCNHPFCSCNWSLD